MKHITTTELRTKSNQLINTLMQGKRVILIHRSRVVADIKPTAFKSQSKQGEITFGSDMFKKALKKLKPKKPISLKERDKRYRAHLMEKYGKHLS